MKRCKQILSLLLICAVLAMCLSGLTLVTAADDPLPWTGVSKVNRIYDGAKVCPLSSTKYEGNNGQMVVETNDTHWNFGWTGNGCFAEYTILVPKDGTYQIGVETSFDGEHSFSLEVDNTPIAESVQHSSTGGWQTYETGNLLPANLTKGEHTLRINWLDQGFNLRNIVFYCDDNDVYTTREVSLPDPPFVNNASITEYDGQTVIYCEGGNKGFQYDKGTP